MPTLPACVRACLRACVRARMRTYEGAATLLHGTDSSTHPDLMVDNVEDARALILTGGHKAHAQHSLCTFKAGSSYRL